MFSQFKVKFFEMSSTQKKVIEIFTDGACRGNPGPGGWGVLLRYQDQEKELWGGVPLTTNNRMELTAAIQGLSALRRNIPVHIYTDSQYVKKGITEWIRGWRQKGWRNAVNKPIKNCDLWQKLDALNEEYQVTWHWIRGHQGHPDNERADQLANRGIEELTLKSL